MTRKTPPFAKTLSALLVGLCASAPAALAQDVYAAPGFTSPSGNITCYIDYYDSAPQSEAGLVCLIFEANWDIAADGTGNTDPDCALDTTRSVELPRSGAPRAAEVCHGDVFWPLPMGAIGYGSTWSLFSYTCEMATTGVLCQNGSGGFKLNRRAFEAF